MKVPSKDLQAEQKLHRARHILKASDIIYDAQLALLGIGLDEDTMNPIRDDLKRMRYGLIQMLDEVES